MTPGLRDGKGLASRFRSPMSLGVDSGGFKLFVLDNTRLIRFVDLSSVIPTVTTLVGGACRAVSRWMVPAAPSVVMRTVGCHPDWLLRDQENEVDPDRFVETSMCVG